MMLIARFSKPEHRPALVAILSTLMAVGLLIYAVIN